jgi:hypothetical protein
MTSLLGMTEARRRIYRAGFDYETRQKAEQAEIKRKASAGARLRTALAAQRSVAALEKIISEVPAPDAIATPATRSRAIISAVARKHGLATSDLTGTCRSHRFVLARHEAIWSVKQATKLSTPEIGRLFGGRDHTTIMYAVKAHQSFLDNGEKVIPVDETAALVMAAIAESGSTGLTSEEIGSSVLGLTLVTSEDRKTIRTILRRVATALARSNRRLSSNMPGHPWARYRVAESVSVLMEDPS